MTTDDTAVRLAAIRARLADLDAAEARLRELATVPPGDWEPAYEAVLEARERLTRDKALPNIRFLLTQLDATQERATDAEMRLAERMAGFCDNCHHLSNVSGDLQVMVEGLQEERDAALAERDAARGEVARLRPIADLSYRSMSLIRGWESWKGAPAGPERDAAFDQEREAGLTIGPSLFRLLDEWKSGAAAAAREGEREASE